MEFIRNWVVSIAAATMIISIAAALCPKNAAGRAVMLCGSLIMTAVLISPLKSFDVSVLSEYGARYEREIEERSRRLNEENETLRKNIIEENTRAYILQRAESMGVSCDVRIICKDDIPYSAYIQAPDKVKAYAVSELIEAECGIPAARQTFKIEV